MSDFDLVGFLVILALTTFLVLLNGFFVAAEFALVSVRPSRVEELVIKTGSRRAKAVKKAIENQDEVISATQLGITMASLGIGYLAGSFIEPFIEEILGGFGLIALLGGLALGAFLAFGLSTYLHVVIGELAPKSVALQYPLRTSLWVAIPLHWFAVIFKPIIWFFNQTGWLVLAIFGIKPLLGHRPAHSEDELKLLIAQSSKAGIIDEHESGILKRTFDLPDTQVRMIMTPRREMRAVSINDPFVDIVKTVRDTGHSRFPVYDEYKERIIGLLYAKDLLQYMILALEKDDNFLDETINISEILRSVDFVPETMRCDRLLEDFRVQKRHSAVVVDEFGELVGLITLEDILELLVGDIQDEYDIEEEDIEPSVEQKGESSVNGQTPLDDFNEYFETNFTSEISVTIGGLIIERIGRIPKPKEVIKIENVIFTVDEVSKSRIISLLAHKVADDKMSGSERVTKEDSKPPNDLNET